MGIIFGLIATLITIAISFVEGIAWALTSGEAILTFFPASMPFLIVSGTMVALAMRILEGMEESGGAPFYGDRLAFLEPAGRLSLTIYVAHFAVLGIVAFIVQGEPRLALILFTSPNFYRAMPLALPKSSRCSWASGAPACPSFREQHWR